ncbi:MAG: hypothetical protein CMD98_04520 [Gammaproteobacteria bacterium]|nr:hypothetical protein [Gammaproteobacteria bacterium]
MLSKLYVFIVFLFWGSIMFAQDLSQKEFVSQTFSHWQLINCQTTEVIPAKGMEFRIQHRFGAVDSFDDLYYQFLGLDLPANIRYSFGGALSDKLYIGIGRAKYGKIYDFEMKYKILRQTKDDSSPISLAAYFNTSAYTTSFPSVPENYYFEDSTTVFEYKLDHRLSYNTQFIIARKFSNKLSLQLATVFIYQNLVPVGKDNYTFAIPVSGRYKVGVTSSILFEFIHVINNKSENHVPPFSLAYEIVSTGHAFQIVLSSTQNLTEQEIYTSDSYDYLDGKFLFGFNIKRNFWRK